MSSEAESEIPPFRVKDALYLHDKRISELSAEIKDKTHETTAIVKGFEDKFNVLMERINKGVSPTMQEIKDKSNNIEKQIIQLQSDMKMGFKDAEHALDVRDVKTEAKFAEIEKNIDHRLEASDALIGGLKTWFSKIAVWATIAIVSAFVGMWTYIVIHKDREAPTAVHSKGKSISSESE